jgi:hypothetical protein
MELTTMIGQRICTGFTGTEVTDEIRDLVKKHKVGNSGVLPGERRPPAG